MPPIDATLPVLALWAVIGYLLGSVPFGMVVSRIMGLGNLRDIGSGNIGATNVLRTGSKPAAALTLLLDGGKGAVAVLLARASSAVKMPRRSRHSSAFSAIAFRSGWASGAARAWPLSSVSCWHWPGRWGWPAA